MCRIGSIKSKVPVHPSKALHLMLPQQEGHDNSGFAMVMQDLYGIFSDYKEKPLLSFTEQFKSHYSSQAMRFENIIIHNTL